MTSTQLASSFRDPSGFIYKEGDDILRQVNLPYQEHYDFLMSSGLYEELTKDGLLIPHEELDISQAPGPSAYKVLKPQQVPFISYPYEWCFSQLKDAALATLDIQKRALAHGMILKDASAYNIQFVDGKPRLIDSLSFEVIREGAPWIAYKQFCEHFLAPLAIMSYRDERLGKLSRIHLDGVPLELAKRLLPYRTKFRFSLLLHIHLQASATNKLSNKPVSDWNNNKSFTHRAFQGLVDSLEGAVKRLKWHSKGSTWSDYYEDNSYTQENLKHKEDLVRGYLKTVNPADVWDLGSNTGLFSRIASNAGTPTIAFDLDPEVIEQSYLEVKEKDETNILPLVMDISNPSPGIGWDNAERMSLPDRGPANLMMALALVHHLSIGNNVPLPMVAKFFRQAGQWAIVEFVPKSDSQVQRLLSSREDIFPNYTREGFEKAFSTYFTIEDSSALVNSDRVLYLMRGI